ncbi:MAG: AIR synthase family protein [Deltaproteobacteria bacterium]|nr:AIR synthase family protein [Deltaproteobacteria bacterium]
MSKLEIGKIHMDSLQKLLNKYTHRSDRVIIGSGIGEDAAVIDMKDRYLIAKTDPITGATDEIGYYVVNINANDIVSMGGSPLWFLATILLPEASGERNLELIFSQISKSCEALGIVYCGGHTEVTKAVTTPVVIGQMLGEVKKTDLKPTSAARVGDDLIITKSAAIEATSLIAREKEKELKVKFPEDLIERAKNFLFDPGISVVHDASVLKGLNEVHALHDPTEGGVTTGIFEMAQASNLGVEVFHDAIPVREETMVLCDFYNINPLGTFASGALLISISPSATDSVIERLSLEGIPAARIGVMVSLEKGRTLIKGVKALPLPVYHQDELSKILG